MRVPGPLLLLLLLVGTGASAQAPIRRPPNVLVVLIDDLGWADIACEGSRFHETPRLDALARTGVRFRSFYSAHPVCSPTRAALMTGKVPQRLGITDWIHPASGVALPSRETTVAEAFQSVGYQTAYLGKWHLGERPEDQPTRHGFEWIRGVNRAGQPASYFPPYRTSTTNSTVWDVPDYDGVAPGTYLTDALTTSAIEFLHQRDLTRPFFLMLGHYAVHTPIQPPKELASKYRSRRAGMGAQTSTRTIPGPNGSVTRAVQDDPDYAAMVENLDANVGRIIDALEQLGLRRDTVIVFTSDNGGLSTLTGKNPGPTCNLPLRCGKGWVYEGGIRIPTWIVWPGRLEPSTVHVPAYTADLYPTLLDLCGIPLRPEQHLDGVSLGRVLRGDEDPRVRNRSLGWYYPHAHGSGHRPSAALRQGPWKLVMALPDGPSELFNIDSDPGETSDRSAAEPDRVRSMVAGLQRWMAATREGVPTIPSNRSPSPDQGPRQPGPTTAP